MKRLLPIFIFLFFTASSFGQFSNTWSVKFADAIRTRWNETPVTGRVCIDKMTSKNWEYSNAIVLHGIEKVYKKVNTAAYRTYIKTYVDDYVDGAGTIAQTINSLDRLHPAILLLFLYEDPATSAGDKTRYKTAADFSRNFLVGPTASYPKTSDNIFWHKNNGSYDNIVMLDGMYMAHPFLAKYGKMFNDNAATDTAVNQILRFHSHVYNSSTKLAKHAWTSTPASYTWDGAGGVSNTYWSRAMGWYMMALVDVLKYVPTSHPRRGELLTALANLADGIKNYQDATSGLWYQVMDQNASLANNYLESSGSAMFIYSLRTATDSGWISSATYAPVIQSAWTGLQTKISTAGDAMPQINAFAPAMGVLANNAAYVDQATYPVASTPGTTHPHGYAAILMAASTMEFSPTLPVKFVSFTAKEYTAKTTLTWQIGDESDVDHYEIQKSINGSDFVTIGNAGTTGSSIYTFDDNAVESRTVYYRINAVYKNGSAHYSVILSLKKNNHTQSFRISPNPVKNGDMNIVTTNFQPGKYNISITSTTGHVIYSAPVSITEGVSGQHIQLPGSIVKGIYYVRLTGEGVTINRNILID